MGNSEMKGSLGQGFGFRIISISQNSPCSEAGIEFFTDFIVDVVNEAEIKNNPLPLEPESYHVSDKKDFFTIVSESENKPVTFVIYNSLKRNLRYINVTPNKQWSQQGNLLGVMLRLENYLHAHTNSFRILSVDQNSPAAKAGLQSKSDYIIGLNKYKYNGIDELINIIFENEGQTIDLIVFSSASKHVRIVSLKPTRGWGGKGLIGCEFAGGVLNQLPILKDGTTSINSTIDTSVSTELQSMNTNLNHDPSTLNNQQISPNNAALSNSPPNIQRSNLSNDPPPVVAKGQTEIKQKSSTLVNQLHKRNEWKQVHSNKEQVHYKDPFSVNVRKKSDSHIEQHDEQQQPQQGLSKSEVIGQQQDLIKANEPQESSSQQIQSIELSSIEKDQNNRVEPSQNDLPQRDQTNNLKILQVATEVPTEMLKEQIGEEEVKGNEKNSTAEIYQIQKEQETVEAQTKSEIFTRHEQDNYRRTSRKNSEGIKKWEYDIPGSTQKYVIDETNLFSLKAKINRPNLLLDENYKSFQVKQLN